MKENEPLPNVDKDTQAIIDILKQLDLIQKQNILDKIHKAHDISDETVIHSSSDESRYIE